MRFEKRVAILSGGGSGMAREAALILAKEGASVVISDINEENLNSVADEIRAIGGKVTTVPGDVTDSKCVNETVGKALEQYGKVDILFNYVGGEPNLSPMSLFTEQGEDHWKRMIELNLWSTIIFSRAVLDSMIEHKYGKIINTAAIAGRIGSAKMVLYSAVKGGIIAFTKALAIEVAPYNINVNCVSPGPTSTPGFNALFGEEGVKGTEDFVPLKRIGSPEDIANAVVFLASDEASFITGQTLAVDGGVTMV